MDKYMLHVLGSGTRSHSCSWRENQENCTSHTTSITRLTEHNKPFPLFLEQYIPFTDDAVPLYVHTSALSRNPGAFRRQHGVYFIVTHFQNFCSPFSLYQKITPSIGFHDWSSRATPGPPASLICKDECLFVWNLYKSTFLDRSEPDFAHVSPLVWRRS
jgi:hypothetical protein